MAAPYATAEQFRSWVGLQDLIDDVVINDALVAASAAVDKYCKTHFWQTTAGTTRVFDTCDAWSLHINDAAAVTAVATDKDFDGTYETSWLAADFQLLPLNPSAAPETLPFNRIRAVGAQTFPSPTRRLGLVQVTGTWGWPAIPKSVYEATLLITNRLVKRRRSPEGVAGFDEFGVVRISPRDDPDAARLLEPYRTMSRQGGWAFA